MARLVLLRFLESYFRHRWLNLLPLIAMIAAGSVYLWFTEPKYAARGTIYVQKQPLVSALSNVQTDFTWQSPAQVAVNELNDLAQTEAFVRSIIAKTRLEEQITGDPKDFERVVSIYQQSLSISPVGDNVVEIYARYEDPMTVQQLVAATMEAFVQWKLNTETQDSLVAEQFFNDTVQPYQADLDKAREELRRYFVAHPEPVRGDRPPQEQLQIDQLQAALDQASERFNDAVKKAEEARLSRSLAESNIRQTYLTIDQPSVPVEPQTGLRDMAIQAAMFLAVGGILSLLCIVGGAVLDRSFRFPIDVQHAVALPTLAQVPRFKGEYVLMARLAAEANAASTVTEGTKPEDSVADGTAAEGAEAEGTEAEETVAKNTDDVDARVVECEEDAFEHDEVVVEA